MAVKYAASFVDARRSAEAIMNTLPICRARKISYSTFTIVDIDGAGETRVIEYDDPPYILVRNGREQEVEKSAIELESWQDRRVYYSHFRAELGDGIVFFSDGVSQAGVGGQRTPLGWGRDAAPDYVLHAVERDGQISARSLAKRIAGEAERLDGSEARDDITCGVSTSAGRASC